MLTVFKPRRMIGGVFFCCAAALLAGCAATGEAKLSPLFVMPVEQWGGTRANETRATVHKISRITLHHQGVDFPRGKDPQKYLRDLQSWSRATKGWIDVPYHYVIDLDGKSYEGRDIRFAGDTNTAYDPRGHALIEVVGNFEDVEPNDAQLDAVIALMASLAARYQLPVTAIAGHRDVAPDTACPGKNLYRYLANGYFREKVQARLATQ